MTTPPEPPIVTQTALPAVLGECAYCPQPVYADQPTSQLDEPLSHVGCAIDARRRGTRQ